MMENAEVVRLVVMFLSSVLGLVAACLVTFGLALLITAILSPSRILATLRLGVNIENTLELLLKDADALATLEKMIAYSGSWSINNEELHTIIYLARVELENTGSVKLGMNVLHQETDGTWSQVPNPKPLEVEKTPSALMRENTLQKESKKPCQMCLKTRILLNRLKIEI